MKHATLRKAVSRLIVATFVGIGILHGGSKPRLTPTPARGALELTRDTLRLQPLQLPQPLVSQPTANSHLTNQRTAISPWTARGAWNDWTRIEFPDGFGFPLGTNFMTGVTVLSQGALRTVLGNPEPIAAFPMPLALEPDASEVHYGLTASNSFVIAWTDARVEREATNRIDAAFELFANGDLTVTYGGAVTNVVARPPEGFVGQGQDNAWTLANFPDDYAAITNKGYETWLDEDYVGVNEQNGHYKASITINQAPSTLHQAPLYLACGPHKVVVASPGTYSFPLEVFETYKVRTYPVALPLAISTDDGYRGDVSPGLMMSAPRRMLASPPNGSFEYEIREEPRLVISPDTIPLNQAVGTHISIWCNVASAARRYGALISREFRLNFCNPSDAEIVAAEVEDLVEIIIDAPLGTCVGTITITDNDLCCGCGSCTGNDCTCGCDCWRHSSPSDTPTNSPSATP